MCQNKKTPIFLNQNFSVGRGKKVYVNKILVKLDNRKKKVLVIAEFAASSRRGAALAWSRARRSAPTSRLPPSSFLRKLSFRRGSDNGKMADKTEKSAAPRPPPHAHQTVVMFLLRRVPAVYEALFSTAPSTHLLGLRHSAAQALVLAKQQPSTHNISVKAELISAKLAPVDSKWNCLL